VWCSHCLEHQRDIRTFLQCINFNTKENGWIAITVPPMKDEIVGGHVTLWNAGLLMYNLILAGIDCSQAKVKTYGYNCSVIVQKKSIEVPSLKYDQGDIKTLSKFFPEGYNYQGFNGNIKELNW
jgi:hypothetical protein